MRYLKATLICGLATILIVAGLYEMGVFTRIDQALWNFLGRVSAPPVNRSIVQYFVLILLGFGIAWTTIDIGRLSLKIVVAIAAFAQVFSLTWVLNLHHVFFSPFPSALAVLLSFAAAFTYSRSEAGERKRTLHLMFGDRISPETFYSLVNSNAPLNFAGEMREASVLVCEVFNQDDLMDSLPTQDYVAMTNLFLRHGSDFLVEKGGYLDECDGESLRVIFGAPLEDANHATVACEAALELVQRIENVNRECDSRWHKTLDFRIGVNSGEIVTAAYGSRRLGTFSVAGEPVEFARRLCSANLVYGSHILIGSYAFQLASEAVEVRPIELVRMREERSREEVYELLGLKHALTDEQIYRRDLYWKGIVYYREQLWDQALEHFHAALSAGGDDHPCEFYIRRIERMRTGTPALEWQSARF